MSELSEEGYAMLRVAVNTARQHQCRSVKALEGGFKTEAQQVGY